MSQPESQNRENKNVADMAETLTPEMFVRKYASAVLGFCLANTRNLHDSEDIMQEVFIKAFRKFNKLKDHSKGCSWLFTIAKRECIDHYRNSKITQTIPDDIPARTDPKNENIARLHRAISKLPEGYREPITLYYLNGHNCTEVAKCLGISHDSVRSTLPHVSNAIPFTSHWKWKNR